MSDGIFLLRGGRTDVLDPAAYETEAVLQVLLADHPEVLAGATTVDGQSQGLLLVRREMPIPSTDGGGATFSLDHLFLDPNGIPVLVEVKRASDTRIRREVVGQMLDYAANGWKYWPVDGMRESAEATASAAGRTAAEAVAELAPDRDEDDFWRDVESNLRSGRIRLIFVADRLPLELVRIIEFLNEQMNPAEVLGVEVLRYEADGATVLVPKVVGATSVAVETKGGTYWTEESFLEEAEQRCVGEDVALLRLLLDHAKERGTLSWGKGATPGVSGWYQVDGGAPRAVWTAKTGTGKGTSTPYVYPYVPELQARLTRDAFAIFKQHLEAVPTLEHALHEGKKYPSVALRHLRNGGMGSFLYAVEAAITPRVNP